MGYARPVESRAHERFRVWLPVQVSSDTIEAAIGVTKDASRGGLLMAATEPLTVGTEVSLTFTLPDDAGNEGSERTVRARIVRMERNADDPHGPWPFRVAVQFLDVVDDLDLVLRQVGERLSQI